MSAVREKFRPSAVVCQCGTDGIAGDPQACFNLTPKVLLHCVQYLMEFNLPLILLGGGRYWLLVLSTHLHLMLHYCTLSQKIRLA